MEPQTKRGTDRNYRVDLPYDSWYEFHADLPEKVQINSSQEFLRLWNTCPEDKDIINVFGPKKVPRFTRVYGKDYKFSRVEHASPPIDDPFVKEVLRFVQTYSELPYNGVVVNYYRDGSHRMSRHSDSMHGLVEDQAIFIFSYGTDRLFRIYSKPTNEIQVKPINIILRHNSLIVLCNKFQEYYQHAIPKASLTTCPDPMINITVRLFK